MTSPADRMFDGAAELGRIIAAKRAADRQNAKDARNARRRAHYAARGPRPTTTSARQVSAAEEDWEPFCTCHRSAPCHYCETLTEEKLS